MSARVTRPRSALSRWLASPAPPAAVEITPRRVTAVAIAGGAGARVLSGYATAALPAGAVDASLNAVNIHDAPALAQAIRTALDGISPRPRRVGLVLPDTIAKVSLIRFEKIPPRAQDLDQLIHWQVRKAAPFRIEEAQVAWIPSISHGEGREFLVTTARRDVIEGYEKACAAAGAYAGLVDLATFNLINLALAAQGDARPTGDWLMVHVAADYATLAVVRGADVIFFRNRMTTDGADLPDLVHQTAMYHEDRLGGGGFSRIVVAGASSRGADEAERLRRQVEERIGVRAEAIPLANAVAIRDRIAVGADLVDTVAPAAGLLLRERTAPRTGGERVA
jgi:type IV pilus assembly protein PilM